MTNETPRIYVADLAAYNNGYLHGVWIDATQDLDEIWAEINAMLKASPVEFAEEYAIHDYENFAGYSVGENEGLESLQAIACFIEEHGDLGGKLLEHWCGDLTQAQGTGFLTGDS
ncbi:MAG: antirestriction protein ArdA [Cyanobacteria bacterium]|nr:antirestriction protein ArdA [Cyanobacteriota bacterium]